MLILKEAEYLKFFDYNYEISHIVDLINSIQDKVELDFVHNKTDDYIAIFLKEQNDFLYIPDVSSNKHNFCSNMIELIFVENEIEASIFTDSIVDSVNKKIIVDVSEIFNQQNPDFFNKLYQIFADTHQNNLLEIYLKHILQSLKNNNCDTFHLVILYNFLKNHDLEKTIFCIDEIKFITEKIIDFLSNKKDVMIRYSAAHNQIVQFLIKNYTHLGLDFSLINLNKIFHHTNHIEKYNISALINFFLQNKDYIDIHHIHIDTKLHKLLEDNNPILFKEPFSCFIQINIKEHSKLLGVASEILKFNISNIIRLMETVIIPKTPSILKFHQSYSSEKNQYVIYFLYEDEKLKDLVNTIKNILNNKEFHKEIFTDKYWGKTFLYMDLSSNLQKNHTITKEHLVKI